MVQLFGRGTIMGALLLLIQTTLRADDVKIGFVVKQPEEPWFQDEWRFAEQAAKELKHVQSFHDIDFGG